MHLNRSTHSRHLKSVRCHRHRSFYPSSQTAQPTQAGTPRPFPRPHGTGGDLPWGPSRSVCASQGSVPPDSFPLVLAPQAGAGPALQVRKRLQEERSPFSENLTRGGAEGGWGIANRQKKSPATPTRFGQVCKSIRIACFTGHVGVGSMRVAFSSTYCICQVHARLSIP